MDKLIAQLNIEHLAKKLAEESDETTRKTLMTVLAEEKAKLAALEDDPKNNAIKG